MMMMMHFNGVSHANAYCTNVSHSLSRIAEHLVYNLRAVLVLALVF